MGKIKGMLEESMILNPELYNSHVDEEFWMQCRKEELLEREGKPTMNIICDKCKEKEMEEQPKSPEAERPVDEELMSNCCTAPFTYPGWPDSDVCSKCYEHADTAISDEIFGDEDG